MRAVLLLPLLLGSCWPPDNGGCIESADTCTDYQGDPHTVHRYANACAGKWADAGCSESKRIGGCRVYQTAENVTITTWFYGDAAIAVDELRAICGDRRPLFY